MAQNLFLHEVIDIVGQGAVPYMEHTVAFDAGAAADKALELVGTWYVVGATGRWPQVVNLWEMVDGWDGWEKLCRRTNLRREANPELSAWWDEAYKHRSGGFDRLLAGAPGCPTLADLRAAGTKGTLFVHELTTVPPGGALDYLAAIHDEWAPVASDHGHELVGLYEVQLGDTEVCTVWATTLESHIEFETSTDDRIGPWQTRRRALTTRWREELMVPCPGTLMGPTTWAT